MNYGGRITDDKDMRTSDILIANYLTPKIFDSSSKSLDIFQVLTKLCNDYSIADNDGGYKFSSSGIYYSPIPDKDDPLGSYLRYIESLPLHAEPEVFGMHENASITSAITDADASFAIILSLQPRIASGKGEISREDQIIDMAKTMVSYLYSFV